MSRDKELVWATIPEPIQKISIDATRMHGLGDPHDIAELVAFAMAPRQASFAQAGAL